MSRSPGAYCIFASSVAQSVSSRLPRGMTGVEASKRPIHARPSMMRCSSLGEEALMSERTRSSRALSEESVAPIALAVTSR